MLIQIFFDNGRERDDNYVSKWKMAMEENVVGYY
jgi:hypothetical protein